MVHHPVQGRCRRATGGPAHCTPGHHAPGPLHPAAILASVLCIPLLLLTATGCGDVSASNRAEPLTVVVNPWPGYSFIYLAEDLGYFREEGISVRLVELESLADGRRVFEQGRADLLCGTLVELLLISESRPDLPVSAIAVTDYSCGADVLLARDTIRSVADLRGRRVGLEPESLDALCALLALSSADLTLDDIHVVPMAQSEMAAAMRQGALDAAQLYPPVSSEVERLPGVHRLWDTSSAPEIVVDVLIAQQRAVVQRRDEMQAFLRAFRRAQRFYEERPEEALRRIASRTRMTASEVQDAVSKTQLVPMTADEQRRLFQKGRLSASVEQTVAALMWAKMLHQRPAAQVLDGSLHEVHP